jgi:hypothetical protein
VQTTFGTALAQSLLTRAVNAVVEVSEDLNVRDFRTCDRNYLLSRRTTSRYIRIRLTMDGNPHDMAGFTGMAMGNTAAATGTDPKTFAFTPLGPSQMAPPVTTIMLAHENGADSSEARIIRDFAIDSVEGEATAGQDSSWRFTVEGFANGDWDLGDGTDLPECSSFVPVMLQDGLVTINATQYLSTTKRARFFFRNGILTGDAAFTGSSVDVTRWIRNVEREWGIDVDIVGYLTDGSALATDMLANDRAGTLRSASLRIGAAGNAFTVSAASAYVSPRDSGQGYAGQAREAVLLVDIRPQGTTALAGSATLPAADQTVDFLVPS